MQGTKVDNSSFQLSLHEDKIIKTSSMEKELIYQEISQLSLINEDEVAIDGVYMVQYDEKLEVGFYLRNSLQESIFHANTPLKLTASDGTILAKQVFDLKQMGVVPSMSVRPWEIAFEPSNIMSEIDTNQKGWKLEFDLAEAVSAFMPVVTFQKEPDQLNENQMQELIGFVKNLPTQTKINITPYQIKQQADEYLEVSFVIRNGMNKRFNWTNIALGIIDSNDQEIAKAYFPNTVISVDSGTFYLKTLHFPPSSVKKNGELILYNWSLVIL